MESIVNIIGIFIIIFIIDIYTDKLHAAALDSFHLPL